MANYRAFHTQLATIMETLTRAAVAEICELVDDGYAVLHIEISRHQKENEELRRKLQLIESIVAARGFSDETTVARDVRCDSSACESLVSRKTSGGGESTSRGAVSEVRLPFILCVCFVIKVEAIYICVYKRLLFVIDRITGA